MDYHYNLFLSKTEIYPHLIIGGHHKCEEERLVGIGKVVEHGVKFSFIWIWFQCLLSLFVMQSIRGKVGSLDLHHRSLARQHELRLRGRQGSIGEAEEAKVGGVHAAINVTVHAMEATHGEKFKDAHIDTCNIMNSCRLT